LIGRISAHVQSERHFHWYHGAMKTTIDAAGRVVVPKQARDDLGLAPGTELELRVVDRRIEIEVPPTSMRLQEGDHGVVAVTDREMPVLTTDMVRDTLERLRR
jgi:AbrB family looped-hinge helix DNA binding protein